MRKRPAVNRGWGGGGSRYLEALGGAAAAGRSAGRRRRSAGSGAGRPMARADGAAPAAEWRRGAAKGGGV